MNKTISGIDQAFVGHANPTSIASANAAESFKRFEMIMRESSKHKAVMAAADSGMSYPFMPLHVNKRGIATGLLAGVLRRL